MPSTASEFENSLAKAKPPVGEMVVLLHGLAAGRAVLKPLEWRLQRRGYETLNWGYGSIRGDIRSLSSDFSHKLQQLAADDRLNRIHLVAHSMGSIIARASLSNSTCPRLGRVVMLCPPQRGSRVAANLSKTLGWLCRPLAQLSDHPDSFVNRLAEPNGYEIGTIAAAYDRVVAMKSTHLSLQTDHIVVDGGHTGILFREDVSCLVAMFLRHGDSKRRPPQIVVVDTR